MDRLSETALDAITADYQTYSQGVPGEPTRVQFRLASEATLRLADAVPMLADRIRDLEARHERVMSALYALVIHAERAEADTVDPARAGFKEGSAPATATGSFASGVRAARDAAVRAESA